MNYSIFARTLVACLLLTSILTSTAIAQKESQPNDFGFELYQRLSDGNQGNIFFSPLSVNTALYMAYSGAEQETQIAFEKMLNISTDKAKNLEHFKTYMKDVAHIKNVELNLINHFWYGDNANVKNTYLQSLKQFNAQSDEVNFLDNPQEARATINEHVFEQSKEKIKDILPENSIDHRTRFVLTNAIYFKGDWADDFDKGQNSIEVFNGTEQVSVDFLNKKSIYPYGETDDAQIITLPYKGHAMSMILILPKADKKLATLESKFNALTYKNWLKTLNAREVIFSMPKFKTGSTIDLASYFAEMGLDIAFGNQANFQGVTNVPVHLSDIFHQSFVEVNETGTEASAATVITAMARGIASDIPIFKANRPFLYIIKENVNDQILFMGRMSNPLQESSELKNKTLKLSANEKTIIHQVIAGETLYKIAQDYDVKASDLIVMNDLADDKILEGQKLVIREEFASKGGTLEIKEKFIPADVPRVYDVPVFGAAPIPAYHHRVTFGETLYSISKKYDIPVKDIKILNELENAQVSVGQELIVNQKAVNTFEYVVKSGDVLSRLAKENNTSIERIKLLNNLSSDLIFVGQTLKIEE